MAPDAGSAPRPTAPASGRAFAAAVPSVPFRQALRVWVRVALLSFGGPAGQIAVMHRILVQEKRWIDDGRFLHALNYTMLLPGPEAQQLATYSGWLLHGTRGGLVAGTLFVVPGFVAILALSWLYAVYGDLAWVEALFYGLKPAVLAVVVHALLGIGRRALRTRALAAVAVLAFVAIALYDVPFPAIVVAAGLVGLIAARLAPGLIAAPAAAPAGDGPRPTLARNLRVVGVWAALWAAPIAAAAAWLGAGHALVTIALFFSKAAVVTFGGAYAVLAYVAQEAVATHGWLQPGEMLDGLGLAETTPGPLIMVVQFVGFLGAYRYPGGLDPVLAAVLGATLTAWVTFTPCFLWIFLGAPYVERLRGNRALSGALTGVTAAVAGVILDLAIWFALHTLFGRVGSVALAGGELPAPRLASVDPAAAAIAALAFVALFRLRWGMLTTLAAAVAAGTLVRLVAGAI